MRAKNINEVTHQWCVEALHPTSIIIDATAGNGHDTLFLSEYASKVYAFDVSELALKNTKAKTKHKNNIIYVYDSHENLVDHVKEKADGIMYNCGYLPQSNQASLTKASSTIASLNNTKQVLKDRGWICITVYLKHRGGAEEAYHVKQWIDKNTTLEKTYTYEGVHDAPIAYFCRIL